MLGTGGMQHALGMATRGTGISPYDTSWYFRPAELAISSLDDVCIQYDGAFAAPDLCCVGLYVEAVDIL